MIGGDIGDHTCSSWSPETSHVPYNKNSISEFSVVNVFEKWNYEKKQTMATVFGARISLQQWVRFTIQRAMSAGN